MTRAYGRIPDRFDPRDLTLSLPAHFDTSALPSVFSLRSELPSCYDQGQLGSCTGNAGAAIGQHALRKQGLTEFTPSRLDLYYQARKIEGTTRRDDGAQLRDIFKAMGKVGMASESLWPYDVTKFAKAPPASFNKEALKHVAVKYLAVAQTLQDLKAAVVAGYPVAFGFTAYASLESDEVAKTGLLPMPKPHEQVIGGHAVAIVGYDDSRQLFEVRNSWGPDFGDGGYVWFPYAYVLSAKLSSDFWVVEAVSG